MGAVECIGGFLVGRALCVEETNSIVIRNVVTVSAVVRVSFTGLVGPPAEAENLAPAFHTAIARSLALPEAYVFRLDISMPAAVRRLTGGDPPVQYNTVYEVVAPSGRVAEVMASAVDLADGGEALRRFADGLTSAGGVSGANSVSVQELVAPTSLTSEVAAAASGSGDSVAFVTGTDDEGNVAVMSGGFGAGAGCGSQALAPGAWRSSPVVGQCAWPLSSGDSCRLNCPNATRTVGSLVCHDGNMIGTTLCVPATEDFEVSTKVKVAAAVRLLLFLDDDIVQLEPGAIWAALLSAFAAALGVEEWRIVTLVVSRPRGNLHGDFRLGSHARRLARHGMRPQYDIAYEVVVEEGEQAQLAEFAWLLAAGNSSEPLMRFEEQLAAVDGLAQNHSALLTPVSRPFVYESEIALRGTTNGPGVPPAYVVRYEGLFAHVEEALGGKSRTATATPGQPTGPVAIACASGISGGGSRGGIPPQCVGIIAIAMVAIFLAAMPMST